MKDKNHIKDYYIKTKDFSISKETFYLKYNSKYDILETLPRPKANELKKYYDSAEYISHTDGKRNLFELAYQIVKKIALKRKLKLINTLNKSEHKTLLDFGCGTGDFIKIAKQNQWNVVGIEPNDKARTIANLKTNNAVYDITALKKIESNSIDVITLWHVMEHINDFNAQLINFKRLIKQNGTLVIALPNYKSYDASYYKSFWAAYDVPRHLWHFSRKSIDKISVENGYKVIDIKPMLFDAFYVSLLSEKYKTGFMNPLKAFYIGLKSNALASQSKEYASLIYILKKKHF